MKNTHFLLVTLSLLFYIHIGQAQITAHVDERFELTSITFALAGVPEYCDCRIPSYFQDIKSYFGPYGLTEAINFVRKLNQKHLIGYNAVANVASLLVIKKGKIVLKDNIDNLTELLGSRWNEKLLFEYIDMLNQFYKESNFHKFFNEHKEIYQIAEQRMNKHFETFNYEWINSFFDNKNVTNLNFYISLVNGPNNYAFSDGVVIGVQGDKEGLPAPNLRTIPILVHEILHHYTHPVFYSFWDDMIDSANIIYPYVSDKMKKIGYGNAQTVILEWLNDLFVLMYLKEMNYELLEFEITRNMQRGFIWMQRSIDFMDNFYLNRERYTFIDDFMPQLVLFLKYTANSFESVINEYERAKPCITNIFPAPGCGLKGVDEVIITFSQPMNGSYGFSGIPANCEPIPADFDSIRWSDDKYSFIIKLNTGAVKENCKYGFSLNPNAFQSSKYYRLNNNVDCNIVF